MSRSAEPAAPVTRTEYFDVLRTLAIVAVVVLHTAATQWNVVAPVTFQWQTLNMYDSITRFCVPAFFMISGALFLDPARPVTIRGIMRRSLPRIAVAYVVWSAFYAGFTVLLTGYQGGWALLSAWVVGHYHLWFLLVLMGLYLVTPLLRRICESEVLARYFVVLALIFAIVLPVLTIVPRFGPMLEVVLDTAQLHLVLGYAVYFVLGHLLHTGLLARVSTGWFIGAGVVALVLTIAVTSWLSVTAGVADSRYYEYLTPNVLVMAVVVFVLMKRWGERRQLGSCASRVVALVGTASFGVYLIHPFFLELLSAAGITTDVLPALVSVALLTIAIFLPSFALAWVLGRIPRVGRYVA